MTVVVTGHQPNFLPGVSVMNKVAAADVTIWMDDMQFERHGFVNRNRFADGSWMIVPVNAEDVVAPISKVRIADATLRFREKAARGIELRLGEPGEEFARWLRRPFVRLVDLNVTLLALLCSRLEIGAAWAFQSRLNSGVYSNVSDGLAAMTAEVGGDVWLSGPSGRKYLDEAPFKERGIEVRYWSHEGPNPSAIELLRSRPLSAAA